MNHPSAFEEALKQAVKPGPERLLVGAAVGASAIGKTEDYFAAFGTFELNPGSPPVSKKTVMFLASLTKLVTAIAALQCVERGILHLDDPDEIDRLLPEWKHPQVLVGWKNEEEPILQPAKERITLRKLLSHTSGIAYDFFTPELMKWRQSRGEGFLAMRGPITEGFTTPLMNEPGLAFRYGGSSDVAGLLIARANNCTLEEYMRVSIFDVLGMNDTSFHVEHNNIGKRLMPMATWNTNDGSISDGCDPDEALRPTISPKDEYGGIGLFGTTEDFLKVLKSILRDDEKVLKSASVDLLFTPCLSQAAQESLNNSLCDPMYASIFIPGEPPVGTPGAARWSHGLGGLIQLDGREMGLKAGNMRWLGAPNLKWWIDREGGVCGVFSTQLLPPGGNHAFLERMFQEEVVKRSQSRD